MKTLLFVGKDVESNVNYIRELKRIFSGYLQIEYCYEAEQNRVGEDMIRKADIILLTNPYSLPQARQYLKKDSKIINMNFTFKRELVGSPSEQKLSCALNTIPMPTRRRLLSMSLE